MADPFGITDADMVTWLNAGASGRASLASRVADEAKEPILLMLRDADERLHRPAPDILGVSVNIHAVRLARATELLEKVANGRVGSPSYAGLGRIKGQHAVARLFAASFAASAAGATTMAMTGNREWGWAIVAALVAGLSVFVVLELAE